MTLISLSSLTLQAQDQPNVQISLSGAAVSGDPITGHAVLAPGSDLLTVSIALTGGNCPSVPRTVPVDVVLVIDISGSMGDRTPEGISKLDATKQAALAFLTRFNLDPSSPLTSDQIALVSFSTNSRVEVGLSRDINQLRNAINSLGLEGGTNIPSGMRVATELLQGPEANFAGDAAPVMIVLSDGQDNQARMVAEAERARQATGVRIVSIGLGAPGDVDQAQLIAIADTSDDAYFTASTAQLATIYDQIATRITPRESARNINVTYNVNTANFTIEPNSQRPANGAIIGNQIVWSFSELLSFNTTTFEIDVRPVTVGTGLNVGDVRIDYEPCQQDNRVSDTQTGPTVSIIPPSPTPTPTSTPTPTVTPTPTNTPTPTPPAPIRPPEVMTNPEGPGVTLAYCGEGVWDWLPILLTLLALLLALYVIARWWGHTQGRRNRLMVLLCFLAKSLFALSFVWLVWLFSQPLVGAICPMPESVYFWRQDGTEVGIFLTHPDLRDGAVPAQVDFMNVQGCTSCHTLSQTGLIGSIVGGVPSRSSIFELDGSPVPISSIDAVYSALSPDGQRLAYSDGNADLFVLDLATGARNPVVGASDNTFGALMPAWSPDGQALVYVRAERTFIVTALAVNGGTSDLYLIPASGGTPQPVHGASNNGSLNYYPSFSPSGEWLAFTRNDQNTTTYSAQRADIWLTNITTGVVKPLETNSPNASDSWPAWNRNGSRLAFNSNRNDRDYDIVYVDIVNGVSQQSQPISMPGASSFAVVEHQPQWGDPIERENFLTVWQSLLPWLLLPVVLGVIAAIVCWLANREDDVVIGLELPPQPKARVAKPLDLEAGDTVPLWQPSPSLVLGLGNAGWHVLTQLKKSLLDAEYGDKPSPKVQLLAVITDEQDRLITDKFSGLRLSETSEHTEVVRWRDSLSDTLTANANNDDPALRDWLDYDYIKALGNDAINPRTGLQGQRTLGRAALIQNLRGINDATGVAVHDYLLQSAQRVLQHADNHENDELEVVIVADLSDEIGSAIFIDMAYLARRLQKQLKLNSVRIILHAMTDVATTGELRGDPSRQINTYASIRELGRIQLSTRARFPMVYSSVTQSNALDGVIDSMLFDEVYIYDGRRQINSLAKTPPEVGIYPAIADTITIWLDSASRKGELDQWRNTERGITNQSQLHDQSLMIGGMGIYQYRLPFSDILADISLRYARTVLQYLLASDSRNLAFDGSLASEAITARGNTPEAIARAFLAHEIVPSNLSEYLRGIFVSLTNIDQSQMMSPAQASEQFKRSIKQISVNAQDVDEYRKWLAEFLRVLLNGRESKEKNDPIRLREAKIGRAYAVLSLIASENGYLVQVRQRLSQESLKDTKILDQLENFIIITRKALKSVEEVGIALGIETRRESLYVYLQEEQKHCEQSWRNMSNLATREYIIKNSDDIFLADAWFEEYLQGEVSQGLQQVYWQVDLQDDNFAIKLKIHLPESDYTFDQDKPESFAYALVRLGRYIAFKKGLKDRGTLLSVLHETKLRDDYLENTGRRLGEASNPMVDIDAVNANRLQRSVILNAHKGFDNNIVQKIQSYVTPSGSASPATQLHLKSSDPFTLSVVQTSNVVDILGITSLEHARQQYFTDAGIDGKVYNAQAMRRSAIFPAEVNALYFERRLREISQSGRTLQAMVVLGLNNRIVAQAYLLAVASGDISISTNSGMVWQNSRLGSAITLLNPDQIKEPKYTVICDGLLALQFNGQGVTPLITDEQAREIIRIHENNDDLLDKLEEFYDDEGLPWRRLGSNQYPAIDKDFIAIALILIRDMIGDE